MRDHGVEPGPENRGLHGHVDELRFAGLQPQVMRSQCADRTLGRRMMPGLRDGDADGAPIGLAVERHRSAHGRQG